MPELRKVQYRGRTLGELRVYGPEDWANKGRPVTDKDVRLINSTAAADCIREILRREPHKVCEEEPDKPWITVVVREVCMASRGTQDERMEEDALLLYVQRHGMDQILSIWGADVGSLAKQLKTMSGLDDSSN